MVLVNRRNWCPLLLLAVLSLGFASQGPTQEANPKSPDSAQTTQPETRPKNPPNLTEWKSLLDHLAVEARTVDPEHERPVIIAEVADAYWNFDKKQARTLLVDAFERALSLPDSQKRREAISAILSLAARRDRALVLNLTQRLIESREGAGRVSSDALSVARDLLETDQALAIELAQSAASLGPSMNGLSFLFKLADRDPAAADRLYDVYLKQLIAGGKRDLSSVLWLAGYPLGYGEAYGGSNDPESFIGFAGYRIDGLRPNPNMARAYLQLAFASVTETLKEAAASDSDRDVLNGLALFTTAYLFPEVQRYLPGAEGAWSGLHRQALTGTSEARRVAVEARLQSILEVRSRTTKYESTEDYLTGDIKETLDLISKMPDACKRDQAYARVVFNLGYAKKFAEARQMADEIESISLRDNVLQFLNYDVAAAAIDAGNLIEASSAAEKVTAKAQRALLFVKIAAKSLVSKDKSGALDLLNRARALVRDSDDAELQVGVLLAVASIYVRFDPLEATIVMREAIKALNHLKNPNTGAFSVLRRVDLSCANGEEQWYGGRETANTFNLYETLALIANSEMRGQEALLIASELENKPTRLRAQLSVVKAMTKDK